MLTSSSAACGMLAELRFKTVNAVIRLYAGFGVPECRAVCAIGRSAEHGKVSDGARFGIDSVRRRAKCEGEVNSTYRNEVRLVTRVGGNSMRCDGVFLFQTVPPIRSLSHRYKRAIHLLSVYSR
jgi:hypothetical protein